MWDSKCGEPMRSGALLFQVANWAVPGFYDVESYWDLLSSALFVAGPPRTPAVRDAA